MISENLISPCRWILTTTTGYYVGRNVEVFGFQAGTSSPGVQRIYDKASGADRFDMNHLLKNMRV